MESMAIDVLLLGSALFQAIVWVLGILQLLDTRRRRLESVCLMCLVMLVYPGYFIFFFSNTSFVKSTADLIFYSTCSYLFGGLGAMLSSATLALELIQCSRLLNRIFGCYVGVASLYMSYALSKILPEKIPINKYMTTLYLIFSPVAFVLFYGLWQTRKKTLLNLIPGYNATVKAFSKSTVLMFSGLLGLTFLCITLNELAHTAELNDSDSFLIQSLLFGPLIAVAYLRIWWKPIAPLVKSPLRYCFRINKTDSRYLECICGIFGNAGQSDADADADTVASDEEAGCDILEEGIDGPQFLLATGAEGQRDGIIVVNGWGTCFCKFGTWEPYGWLCTPAQAH
mmetsp:Transcript_21006/g.29406  ORF Transcript_21006/g.29406 Transcript_21006/m.29406 type:complete len:341 (+) Transcript_21006:233-1255(+)